MVKVAAVHIVFVFLSAHLVSAAASNQVPNPEAASTQSQSTSSNGKVAQDAILTSAKLAATSELTRTLDLLRQAQGYREEALVAAAQDRLKLALEWDNVDEIKVKTDALVAVNLILDQFIQNQTLEAEAKAVSENPQSGETTTSHDIEPPLTKSKALLNTGVSTAGPVGNSSPRMIDTTGRRPSRYWDLIVLILLGVDWIYCLSQGLDNQLVLYFDGLDVFVSVLGPLLVCTSVALYGTCDTILVTLLAVAGAVCSIVTIRSSIKHNRAIPVGCAVALFKLSFSFLWFALLLGQLGRGADDRKSSSERLRETIIGLVVAVLLWRLMKRLINGRAVYAMNGLQG